MKYLLVFASFVFHLLYAGYCQDSADYPIPGKPCPDFLLDNLYGKPGEKISLSDLKGRHVILDFWGVGCVACIRSFPKLNELNQKYDNLDIILIGFDKYNIQGVYEKYQERYNLTLTSAFDTKVKESFRIQWFPTHVWIDPDGIVKAVTATEGFTEENIIKFLNNTPFDFYSSNFDADTAKQNKYEPLKPFLIDGNGGASDTSYIFRSVLSEWRDGMGEFSGRIQESGSFTPKFEALKINAIYLFNRAYIENSQRNSMSYRPELQVSDSTVLLSDKRYCYSISVPKSKWSQKFIMKAMQNDLENYFGYRGEIQEREVDRYYLTDRDGIGKNNIKSTSPENKVSISDIRLMLTKSPFEIFWDNVNLNLLPQHKLINETGIEDDFFIDVDLQTTMLDFESVCKSLEELGFKVEKRKGKINVLVLKDAI